jgi:tetratricopeptide (TPR) repeat protein
LLTSPEIQGACPVVSSPDESAEADIEFLRNAVATCRADPTAAPKALASVLNDLAGRLYALDRVEEALGVSDEAVEAAARAMELSPDSARYVLVSAQINRAGGRLRQGDAVLAAEGLAEATDIFRRGGEAGQPYLGPMIEALHRASLAFSEVGLWDMAVRMRRLTLDLFGEAPPAPAVQILALTLVQASNAAAIRDEAAMALVLAEEAVGLARLLSRTEPGGFRLLLAQSLGTLAGCLHRVGRSGDGLDSALESVDLLHTLVPDNPLAAVPSLVLTLESLSAILSALGLGEQAASVEAQLDVLRDSLARLPPG